MSAPTWGDTFIVNNSIVRNEIHVHKQIIEEYRKNTRKYVCSGNI